MRHRGKPWADVEMAENPRFLPDPTAYYGRFNEVFANENPIHLEIGCGKGGFITQCALGHPGINFIGLEKEELIIAQAMRLAKTHGLPENLYFICANAEWLQECLAENELARVYLNFSDPWRARSRWRKRRLTHNNFLAAYESLMRHPEIFFKTDDRNLFNFSIAEFEQAGWVLDKVTYDLHNSEYAEGNIQTEYEQRWVAQGKPIHRLEARKGKM